MTLLPKAGLYIEVGIETVGIFFFDLQFELGLRELGIRFNARAGRKD